MCSWFLARSVSRIEIVVRVCDPSPDCGLPVNEEAPDSSSVLLLSYVGVHAVYACRTKKRHTIRDGVGDLLLWSAKREENAA